MTTIFDTVFNSTTGLGDVAASVDPFTGKSCLYIPPVVRFPGKPLLMMEKFVASVQQQMIAGSIPSSIDPRLASLKDTFNPGLAHYNGQYVMIVRFQDIARINDLYLAHSPDGINWIHNPVPLDLKGLPASPEPRAMKLVAPELPADKKWLPGSFYDPRITQMDSGEYLIALAVDYDTVEEPGQPYTNICDNVLYRTTDFKCFEYVTTIAGATRNCVIFPRKIDDYYYAAGRPNTDSRHHTVLLRSPDLVHWERTNFLFSGGHAWMCYAGPGFPPFETDQYWVMGVHGVETHGQHRVHYRAGVCLIDKKTMTLVAPPVPIIDPHEPFELTGIVDNVIFPTGVLFGDGSDVGIKSRDTRLAIYYGGADRIVHAGLTTVGKLVDTVLGRYNPFHLPKTD